MSCSDSEFFVTHIEWIPFFMTRHNRLGRIIYDSTMHHCATRVEVYLKDRKTFLIFIYC